MEIEGTTHEAQVEELENRFSNERTSWRKTITEIGKSLKDMNSIATAQVNLYSQRQILTEYQYDLGQLITKLAAKNRKMKAQKLKHHTENADFKYGTNEKNILIDGDLTELTQKTELVENHRKYIDETLKTIDHQLYGIKTRIELEKYLRGDK